MRDDLKSFFLNPQNPKHRQFEALRSYIVDELPAKEAAERFGFTEKSLYSLAHDLRTGRLDLFPSQVSGPKNRRITPHIQNMIIELRKKSDFSTLDIVQSLEKEEVVISESTVERVLKDAGFSKLQRRTSSQKRISKNNTILAQTAQNIDFKELKPFHSECQIAGAFLFLPYILESGVYDVFQKLPLPESNRIGKLQAGLSFLLLKLIGGKRLSHVRQYDNDVGFGIFAGLNVLPKPTYMGTYSCRLSQKMCQELQTATVKGFLEKEPDLYLGNTINLDFHSIPHFGEQSQMEKVWCGSRNKAMKGANTFFAQDATSNALLYANSDVLRKDGAKEILRFAEYLKGIKGVVKETLVFDSRLTSYEVLNELNEAGISFITLRNRCKSLKEQTDLIPDSAWKKVKLPIPKRKHQKFLVYESEVTLSGVNKPLRQIIMKDHGRAEPTYVITNNRKFKLVEALTVYAKRWRIENKLSELIEFFNINRLSSPIMVRIYFDLLLSMMASFLYRQLAKDLPRFEDKLAPEIFRRFIDMPGNIRFDGKTFEVRIRKRAHTPILLGLEKLQKPITIPWLQDKQLKIVWTS
jgi:transposase